jgi:uncharacterized membrane protein YphA (DoxX/SURF4 family)
MLDAHVNRSWWVLRIVYGLVPIVAGFDKFTNLLVDWDKYLSPVALDVVPLSATLLMQVVGVVEIVAGFLVLALPRLGGYVVSAWLIAIAANLVSMGRYYDIAVRDVVMAMGAFVLAQLSAARRHVTEPVEREYERWEPSRARG